MSQKHTRVAERERKKERDSCSSKKGREGKGGSCLVEVAEDLATSVTTLGLLVVHDAEGGGEDDEAKLTAGEDIRDPLIETIEGDIETGGEDTALVDAAEEGDDNLAVAVVVDNLVLTDVTVHLHNVEEAEDHTAAGADDDLTLAEFLSVEDGLEGISKNVGTNHVCLYI